MGGAVSASRAAVYKVASSDDLMQSVNDSKSQSCKNESAVVETLAVLRRKRNMTDPSRKSKFGSNSRKTTFSRLSTSLSRSSLAQMPHRSITAGRNALTFLMRTRETKLGMGLSTRNIQTVQVDNSLPTYELLLRASLVHIMGFLEFKDLATVGAVNHQWNDALYRHLKHCDGGFSAEENEWIRTQLGYNESFFLRSMVQNLCEMVNRLTDTNPNAECTEISHDEVNKLIMKVRQHHFHFATCPAVAMAMLNGEPDAFARNQEHEIVFRAKYSRHIAAISNPSFIVKTFESLSHAVRMSSQVLIDAQKKLTSSAEEEIRLQAMQFFGDTSCIDERCSTTEAIYSGDITASCGSYFTKIEACLEAEHQKACAQLRAIFMRELHLSSFDTYRGFEHLVPKDQSWEAKRNLPAILVMSETELVDANVLTFLQTNLLQICNVIVRIRMTAVCQKDFLSEAFLVRKVLAKLENLINTCTPPENIIRGSYESLIGIPVLHPTIKGVKQMNNEQLAMLQVKSCVDEYLDYFIDQRWLEEGRAGPPLKRNFPTKPEAISSEPCGWLFTLCCRVYEDFMRESTGNASFELTKSIELSIHQDAMRRYIHHTLMKENVRLCVNHGSRGSILVPMSRRIEVTNKLIPALLEGLRRDLGPTQEGAADDFEKRIFGDEHCRLLKVLHALTLRELVKTLEQKRHDIEEYEKQSLKAD